VPPQGIATRSLGTADLKVEIFFSVATDASNKGNIKCYPIVVKYFSEETCIKKELLNFYKDFDETANAIFDKVYLFHVNTI
jgi:hypothetical protein